MLAVRKTILYTFVSLINLWMAAPAICQTTESIPKSRVTVLCYMNGDNELAQEVLHTVDMLEMVGSSPDVNVIALVDGHPEFEGIYADTWKGARLLHLKTDPEVGRIQSDVLAQWDEADLGSAHTLETFVRTALERFPAQRYIFYAFAHGRGVINTKSLVSQAPGKSLSISRDDTNRSEMGMDQFRQALYNGLEGKQFDLMVMFSCLSGMLEVSYALSDITHYLVASQDEIRLLNQPPGAFQIRGLKIEQMLNHLHRQPDMDARVLGRHLVDSHYQSYQKAAPLWADQPSSERVQFDGSMALMDCKRLPQLVQRLDQLAQHLISKADDPGVIDQVGKALYASQSFPSFLNMEYYDLADFIQHLTATVHMEKIRTAGEAVLKELREGVVLYEQHTQGQRATGLSIYMSHPLIPYNIFTAHQAMYRQCRFSSETQWDEWIDLFRNRWDHRRP